MAKTDRTEKKWRLAEEASMALPRRSTPVQLTSGAAHLASDASHTAAYAAGGAVKVAIDSGGKVIPAGVDVLETTAMAEMQQYKNPYEVMKADTRHAVVETAAQSTRVEEAEGQPARPHRLGKPMARPDSRLMASSAPDCPINYDVVVQSYQGVKFPMVTSS